MRPRCTAWIKHLNLGPVRDKFGCNGQPGHTCAYDRPNGHAGQT